MRTYSRSADALTRNFLTSALLHVSRSRGVCSGGLTSFATLRARRRLGAAGSARVGLWSWETPTDVRRAAACRCPPVLIDWTLGLSAGYLEPGVGPVMAGVLRSSSAVVAGAACQEASENALTGTSGVAMVLSERSNHPHSTAGRAMISPRAAARSRSGRS